MFIRCLHPCKPKPRQARGLHSAITSNNRGALAAQAGASLPHGNMTGCFQNTAVKGELQVAAGTSVPDPEELPSPGLQGPSWEVPVRVLSPRRVVQVCRAPWTCCRCCWQSPLVT